MTHEQAETLLQEAKTRGLRPGLSRIARLCALLGEPQDSLPCIHVAGTNGKGSISAMIASMLRASGYKTGLFLSPCPEGYRYGLMIDGEPAPPDAFAAAVADVLAAAAVMDDPPTEFELLTAAAFLRFSSGGCDAAVIEAGMGGRLDATNVLRRPVISAITSVSLDHTEYLGDTLSQIAAEKSGVIKKGGATVCYPVQDAAVFSIIRRSAAENGNALLVPDLRALKAGPSCLDGTDIFYRGLGLHVPLNGRHQVYNAVTAVECMLHLRSLGWKIPDAGLREGMALLRLPLRQQAFGDSPVFLLDGAHNLEGIEALAHTVETCLKGRRVAVIMGMLRDKDYAPCIRRMARLCGRFIAVPPENERALEASAAARIARTGCRDVLHTDDYAEALDKAAGYAGKNGVVVACGSLYLASPLRNIIVK